VKDPRIHPTFHTFPQNFSTMKPASITQLKEELRYRTKEELLEYCLRMARFKKENKELFTYLLFYKGDEQEYIEKVKAEIQRGFSEINTTRYYFIKKTVRRILKETKKFIRYSGQKETEVELLIYFCQELQKMKPSFKKDKVLKNTFSRQLIQIQKRMEGLHEDLQYDYRRELEDLRKDVR